jgi:hypothetical protein
MADARLAALLVEIKGATETPEFYTQSGVNGLSDVRNMKLLTEFLSYSQGSRLWAKLMHRVSTTRRASVACDACAELPGWCRPRARSQETSPICPLSQSHGPPFLMSGKVSLTGAMWP